MVTETEFKFMVNSLISEVIEIISEREGVDYITAATKLYASALIDKIQNPSTGLYFQSPGYVYSFLKQ